MSEGGEDTLVRPTTTETTARPSILQNLVRKLRNVYFILISLVIFTFLILLTWRIIQEIRQDPLVIQPFTVPEDLEKQGYSGKTIARMLADHMGIIQSDLHKMAIQEEGARKARKYAGRRQGEQPVPSSNVRARSTQIEDTEKKELHEIALPGIGLSLNTIIAEVRRLLHLEPSLIVSGYVAGTEDRLSLTVRSTNKPPRTFYDKANNLDQIIKDAASYILTFKEPLDLGLDFCFASNTSQLKSMITTLRGGILSNKDRAIVLILEGCVLGKENEANLALKKLEAAMKIPLKKSKSIRSVAYRMAGDFLQESNRYNEAIEQYKKSIKEDPKNLEAYTRLAYAFLAHSDFAQADKTYHKAMKLEENNAWIYLAWGYALWDKGESERGIEKFTQAIELAPESEVAAWAYLGWGELLREQAQSERGIEKFTQAIELAPESEVAAWVYVAWGHALIELKKPEEAIVQYQKALELAPKNAGFYGGWGDALRDLKKPEEAIVQYQKALELAPKEGWPYGAWGDALRDLKKPEEAIVQYQKALELAPKHAWLYGAWGRALRELKKPEEAIVQYQKALELAPKEGWLYRSLCWTGSLFGKAVNVMDTCEQAVELEPDDVSNHDSRGLARVLIGDYLGAIEDFNFVLKYTNDNSNGGLYSKREVWITELKVGRNPINEATLEELQKESELLDQ